MLGLHPNYGYFISNRQPEDQWSCKRSPDLDTFTCSGANDLGPQCPGLWPSLRAQVAARQDDMFSWYKYLIVNLVFPHLVFCSGNLFLIAPFPDLCLLVVFFIYLGLLNIATQKYESSGTPGF